MPQFSECFIKTPSGRLAVWVRQGEGMPLLFWPSIFHDHRLHDGLARQLANPLAVMDGPGHGASDIDPSGLHGEALGRSALMVAEAVFGQDRFVFSGTSWGALAGIELAALAPENLAGLALFNPPFKDPFRPSIADRAIALAVRLVGNSPVFKRGVARSFFTPETWKNRPEVISTFMAQDFSRPALHTAVRSVLVERHARVPAAPENVRVPALVVSGEFDRLYPIDTARRMTARMPDAEHTVMPGTAHISIAERPELAATLLRRLISQITPERIAA